MAQRRERCSRRQRSFSREVNCEGERANFNTFHQTEHDSDESGEGGLLKCVAFYGGQALPGPSAVVMAYTGYSEYSPDDPPTFVVVGERDGIAPPYVIKRRVSELGLVLEDRLGFSVQFPDAWLRKQANWKCSG